jgi:hypothetical protein
MVSRTKSTKNYKNARVFAHCVGGIENFDSAPGHHRADQLNKAERQMKISSESERRKLALAIRDECIRASLEGYENAAASGLCHEGAWEAAVSAMRMLNMDAILETVKNGETGPRN